MRCSDFLELYSDYRDELITDPLEAQRIQQHLRRCSRCMNYDAVVSRGVMALRATSDINPSFPALRRLENRLAAVSTTGEAAEPVRLAPAGIMAVLMLAASSALLFWASGESTEPATVSETAPAPPPPPFVAQTPEASSDDFTELSVPAFGQHGPAATYGQVSFGTWVTLSH